MAEQVVAAPAAAAEGEEQGGFNWKRMVMQMVFFQLVMRFFGGSRSAPKTSTDPVTGEVVPPLTNSYAPGTIYDFFLFVSRDEGPFEWQNLVENGQLIWSQPDQIYDAVGWKHPATNVNVTYTPSPDDIQHFLKFTEVRTAEERAGLDRKQLYLVGASVAHEAYLERNAEDLIHSEMEPDVDRMKIAVGHMPLILYTELFSLDDELQSLLGNDGESMTAEAKEISRFTKEDKLPHWKSKVDIRVIFDTSTHGTQTLSQPGIAKHMRYDTAAGKFSPILFMTDFWLLEREYIALNSTNADAPLNVTVSLNTMSQWWFMLQSQMADAWNPEGSQSTSPFSIQQHSRKETFMLKRILLDTSPFFLGFSAIFIALHSVFSFLAFKNDIHFWHKNDSMEGLSALSVLTSFVCEVVIGLYLFDSEDTSFLILFEIVAGIAISAWKLTKAVKLSFSTSFPFISIGDAKDYEKSDTKKYDEVAIKFMTILLLPCMLGYAIYALKYNKYRSWYSYTISVLAGTVYTFGFIMMTPQLYINYKMQSVDHLPWRALVYKALNTFVDDIAAFMIDMPWMHRLACFRDDIIFVCYIYQRWAYRVDKTRPSEWVDPKEREAAAAREAAEKAAADKRAPSGDSRIEDIDAQEAEAAAAAAASEKEDTKAISSSVEKAQTTEEEGSGKQVRRRAAASAAVEQS